MAEKPVLAVIGGSGLYQFSGLKDVTTLEIDTPFGKPSSPIILGSLQGHRVAFLARHGIGHVYSPGEVNYRANIFALKLVGAERIVSISACGSLRADFQPGHIIVPDQIFDNTRQRERSFFGNGLVVHVGVANPFCPELSEKTYQSVLAANGTVHKGGSLITIEGPRFSTRAESNVYRAWGMDIIGMTASPECFLAREAEICYAAMAHVTDYDVWHISEEPVSVEMVVKTLLKNTEVAQKAIVNLVSMLDDDRSCDCPNALRDAIITHPEKINPTTVARLEPLVGKYIKP